MVYFYLETQAIYCNLGIEGIKSLYWKHLFIPGAAVFSISAAFKLLYMNQKRSIANQTFSIVNNKGMNVKLTWHVYAMEKRDDWLAKIELNSNFTIKHRTVVVSLMCRKLIRFQSIHFLDEVNYNCCAVVMIYSSISFPLFHRYLILQLKKSIKPW